MAEYTLPQYIEAVKVLRKKQHGRETYGRWTRLIKRHFAAGTSVADCVIVIEKG